MTLPRLLLGLFVILVGILAWLIWPIYGFYAHQGDAPFPPWGWLSMEGQAPSTQDVLDPRYGEAGSALLAAMAAYRETMGAPAMTAAVAVQGQVVWRGAVGWVDIEAQKPARTDSIFRVGSTSKAITAMALARLVEKGIVDLDTPISQYISDLPNPEWATITPRMLASHMAGIPHYDGNRDGTGKYVTGALRKNYKDVRDALEVFDESPLLFAPGEKFEYSSLGTVLLGAVMSKAAGLPYRSIVQQEVLIPAGMNDTLVAPKRAGDPENLANFYYHEADRYRVWRPIDLSHRLPGGGWASTSSDLVRMGAMALDDDYISAETRELFWTPQRLNNGEVNEQNYALGWRWREWEVEGVGLARNANHGGVSRGAQSWLIVFPDYDMAIAFNINANTDEFWDFGVFWESIFREFAPVVQD